jgi:hypothetical protein
MRRHPVTLRHTLLAAVSVYSNEDADGEWVTGQARLIIEMFSIPENDSTWDTLAEMITGKLSLETGIGVLNAHARRHAELKREEP